MRAFVAAALVLALAPSFALAQQDVSGTLEGDPLRLVSGGQTYTITNTGPLVDRVRAMAGEKHSVRATLDVSGANAELVAIHGTTRSDAKLLDTTDLGSTSLGDVRAATDVLLTGASGNFFAATVGGKKGYLPADFVEIGTGSTAGSFIGDLLAPAFAFGAKLRQSRFFHPSGRTYYGTARSVAPAGDFAPLGKKLEGGVLARFGGGLLKFTQGDKESSLPDVPGFAFRFMKPTDVVTTDAQPGDQDLLFTAFTERFRTLVTGISFLAADAHDFFDNDYFTDEQFTIAGVGDVWVRVVPKKIATHGATRAEKFDNAVKEGQAVFTLSVQRTNSSWTREWLGVDVGKLVTTGSLKQARAENPWVPLVEITFEKSVDLDQGKLHFHPGLQGRGLSPRGILPWIRDPVYGADQAARPGSEPIVHPSTPGMVKKLDEPSR